MTENLRHSVRYTLRADEIQNVDNDASVFIRDEEGERSTSLVGQTFSYDRRDVRFLPSEGYYLRLDQDLAGLGGDNRFIRHEARAEYYYPIIPDVVFNLSGSRRATSSASSARTCTCRTASSSAATICAASSSVASARAIPRPTTGWAAISIMSARPRSAFPLGLPEELRVFGRGFVDAGSLRDIDVSGPTLDESNGLRVAAGVGLSWLSPLGPLSIDFAQAIKKEVEGRDRVLPPVLRHPVLMAAGGCSPAPVAGSRACQSLLLGPAVHRPTAAEASCRRRWPR